MWANRWFKHEIRVPSPEYAVDRLKIIPGKIIDSIINDKLIDIYRKPQNEVQNKEHQDVEFQNELQEKVHDIIVTCFTDEEESRHIIHLVNIAETLPRESCDIGHSDIIPAFTGSGKYELKGVCI